MPKNHTLKREEFYDEFDKLRPAINQRGREIAIEAGISYGTYLSYIRGTGANPEIMENILRVARKIAVELRKQLNELEL
jgi:hypothetical protein